MPLFHLHADAEALLQPVLPVLSGALQRFEGQAPLAVRLGEVPGFHALEGDTLTLSRRLAEGLHHPDEPDALPPLDRWRRAACSVLEALALRALAAEVGAPPGPDWRWQGAALDQADAAAPALGLAAHGLALAVSTGDLGAHPRAGVAVMQAWRARGIDPQARVVALLREDEALSAQDWLQLGQRVLSPEGALAALPAPVPRRAAETPPLTLPPWSWRPVRVDPHRRGGRLAGTAVAEPWVRAGQPHATLASATQAGATLRLGPGGPVGAWELASLSGFGQIMGARGIELDFQADGRLQMVLADSFVGPVQALGVADDFGTSGTAMGRWTVTGPGRLRMVDLVPMGLTVHDREGMAMPAGDQGWLHEVQRAELRWSLVDGRLHLQGRMFNADVELRLKRA
ncbi:MAG: hypothetical protein H6739_14720 [Alphaproteobacteria bacterium]|nr:hypothetical protein [Alphaproteobacteria bacterium]